MFLRQYARTPARQQVIIIGGGISGLTCAWRLKQAGIPFVLLEQSSHLGGCIGSVTTQGYLLELGPNTFLNSSKKLWGLAESVGLKSQRIETPSKVGKKRYVYKDNRLISVPAGPHILFSPVLSIKGRLRLLQEPFIKSPHPPFRDCVAIPSSPCGRRLGGGGNEISGVPPFEKRGQGGILDETLASFVRRRLGDELLNTLVTPFVSGIYAGDPERLSAQAVFPKLIEIEKKYGSIFKGMKDLKGEIRSSGLGSFKDGMGELTTALEAKIKDNISKNSRVTSVAKLQKGYLVRYSSEDGEKTVTADIIICSAPAYASSGMLSSLSPSIKEHLQKIEYAPIVVVHTGFSKSAIPNKPTGFGFLVPRKNRIRILGSLFSSDLFTNRAPDGKVLLTSFIGGLLDPEAVDLTNDDILRVLEQDLNKILGIKSAPDFICITKYTHAIPQYHIGHIKLISKINAEAENIRGLYLTGSYFTGISVAGTIEHAEKTAEDAIKYIRGPYGL